MKLDDMKIRRRRCLATLHIEFKDVSLVDNPKVETSATDVTSTDVDPTI